MAADRSPPKTLAGFLVQSELGRGGMGVVYACWDESLQRRVAVKVLADELAADADLRSRFLREARAAAALSHPNIATVYAIHAKDDEPPAIVMELVEGHDLRRRLREGPLGVEAALSIASGVASAIAKAHAAGIVHRDLKPENILLGAEGQVKLLDFGIAKALDRGPDLGTGAGLTATGQIIGTAGYMAPEQIDGLEIDPRTDVFAFGVIVFEMLSGRVPYDGASAAQRMAAVLRDPPADLVTLAPETPDEVVAWVRSCVERDREKRPVDGAALVATLAELSAHARVATPLPRSSSKRSEPILLVATPKPSPSASPVPAASPAAVGLTATPPAIDFEARTELSASSDVSRAATPAPVPTAVPTRRGRSGLAIAGFIVAAATIGALLRWPPGEASEASPSAALASGTPALSSVPAASASTFAPPSAPPSAPAPPSPEDLAREQDAKLEFEVTGKAPESMPTTFECSGLGSSVDSSGCSSGAIAWCDTRERRIACCGPGLVPFDTDGACGCPPGGSSTIRYNGAACDGKPKRTGLPGEAIQAAVRTRFKDIQACYSKALEATPDKGGSVMLQLLIAPNGRLFSVRVQESSLPLPSAQKCMLDAIRKLELPPLRGAHGLTVTYPIDLSP